MDYGFDTEIDRSRTHSSKWEKYAGRDILPFWVADMDFAAPRFILDAVRARLDHGIIGYTRTPASLVEAFQGWLQRNYNWTVPEEWLVWLPGVVSGFNLAARAVAGPDGAIVIPTPVYYPFLSVPKNAQQRAILTPLSLIGSRWCMDFDVMQHAMDAQPELRGNLLMLSNPQNPTGRAYSRAELIKLADFCLKNDLILCSDEIHSPIILDPDSQHIPVASLGPEIAERSISLYAATKTYNIPGLSCAVAVIPDARLRRSFIDAMGGMLPGIGPLSLTASEAAFKDQSDYVPSLLEYLRANLARTQEVIGSRMTPVEATYLAWIDLSDTAVADHPGAYLESHGIGLSDGGAFGGKGYVRFNFGCPRSLLDRGLERYAAAMAALPIAH